MTNSIANYPNHPLEKTKGATSDAESDPRVIASSDKCQIAIAGTDIDIVMDLKSARRLAEMLRDHQLTDRLRSNLEWSVDRIKREIGLDEETQFPRVGRKRKVATP